MVRVQNIVNWEFIQNIYEILFLTETTYLNSTLSPPPPHLFSGWTLNFIAGVIVEAEQFESDIMFYVYCLLAVTFQTLKVRVLKIAFG